MTGIVASTLALLIAMIIALDWPFRGEISVSPDPFIMIRHSWVAAIRAWGKLICIAISKMDNGQKLLP
jgi:hypothetical protein